MGEWYRIGIFLGIGVGIGILFAGLLATRRAGVGGAIVVAAALGAVVGAVHGWGGAVAGGVGGALGALGTSQVVRGAARRGGTRAGLGTILAVVGGAAVGLAFVPAVGYLEAVAVPLLGARLRRRADGRHAGLRILARD
jgi:hypothetical protein